MLFDPAESKARCNICTLCWEAQGKLLEINSRQCQSSMSDAPGKRRHKYTQLLATWQLTNCEAPPQTRKDYMRIAQGPNTVAINSQQLHPGKRRHRPPTHLADQSASTNYNCTNSENRRPSRKGDIILCCCYIGAKASSLKSIRELKRGNGAIP